MFRFCSVGGRVGVVVLGRFFEGVGFGLLVGAPAVARRRLSVGVGDLSPLPRARAARSGRSKGAFWRACERARAPGRGPPPPRRRQRRRRSSARSERENERDNETMTHPPKGARVDQVDLLKVRLAGEEHLLDLHRPLEVVRQVFLELYLWAFLVLVCVCGRGKGWATARTTAMAARSQGNDGGRERRRRRRANDARPLTQRRRVYCCREPSSSLMLAMANGFVQRGRRGGTLGSRAAEKDKRGDLLRPNEGDSRGQ